MQRIIALFLCIACAAPAMAAEAPQLGVVWFKESGMAQRVLKGMLVRLRETAPQIQVETHINLADAATAAPIYERYQQEKDGIVFLRSAGATYLAEHPPQVPAFIGAANHPEQLGVMADMTAPDGRITGVTYYVPTERHFALYRRLLPDLDRVGLLVQEGHPSASIDQQGTEAYCAANDIAIQTVVCADKKALALGVRQLLEDEALDLIIMGNQGLLIDNGDLVARMAGDVPVVSYSEKPVTRKQVLGGLAVDDEKLGALLADAVVQVLVEGTPVAEVPVATDPAPRMLINMAEAERLGITIDDDLRAEVTAVE